MACGRVENCSDQPQIEYLSELDQFLDYNTNKKRFLWNGNADDLGKFIEDRILSHDEDKDDASELVISSNSQCAVFKTPSATINFYYSTKTLHVQGKACSEMRNRLLGVFNLRTNSFQRRQDNDAELAASLNDQNSANEISVLSDSINNEEARHNHSAVVVMPDEHSESQSTSRISTNEIEPSSSNTELGKTDLLSESCNCRNEVHKLWIAVESINSQLKYPSKQASTIEFELNQYKLKCATYEDKIKRMEQEKVCLLESLRILSTESFACSKVFNECAVNDQQESPGNSIKKSGNHERSTQGERSTVNDQRESPGESITLSGNHERSTQGKRLKNNPNRTTQKISGSSNLRQPANSANARRSSQNKEEATPIEDSHSASAKTKPVTVVCGDSIVQNVRGWKLSRSNKVVVKSFSGATTSDMEDYLKPITRKCPDSLILHVGTNDLLSIQTPQQVAESIVNLADQIESDSPGTLVSISAICVRKENELWKKATEINKLLKRFCSNRGWGFLSHNNIDSSCLNASGLHLNRKGVSILSSNFLTHIDNI